MALPKKGFRKIVVNDITYVYKISGEDYGISFLIGLPNINGQLLTGNFPYNSNMVTNFNDEGIAKSWNIYPRTIVTPKAIRQVILYGLNHDWKPIENLQMLSLGNLDKEVELQLKPITKFPDLEEGQAVVTIEQVFPYKRLTVSLKQYDGYGEIYNKFDTIQEALTFAKKVIRENLGFACWILSDFNEAKFYIHKDGIKKF